MRRRTCANCTGAMQYAGREKLQLGKTGWILGDLPNLLAGALEVDIYLCPDCGKIEFYTAEFGEKTNRYRNAELPDKECPGCGLRVDFDYPKCPCCDYEFK